MRAFENTTVTKPQLIASLTAHAAADHLRQNHGYWMDGKGCAVGCSLVDFGALPSDHRAYEPLFGIPYVLARLEDGIFERLPAARARTWPLDFAEAIRPGADLSLVWPRFAVWLLVDKDHGLVRFAKEKSRLAIEAVAALYARRIAGEEATSDEFKAAAAAAYAAGAYAADEAAYAAAAYAADEPDEAAAYAAVAAAYANAAYARASFSEKNRVRLEVAASQADALLRFLAAA